MNEWLLVSETRLNAELSRCWLLEHALSSVVNSIGCLFHTDRFLPRLWLLLLGFFVNRHSFLELLLL